MSPAAIAFAKGHGTGNDFVLLPGIPTALPVTDSLVRALCDRRRGIGADGVLVVARTADHPEVADQASLAPYFMDYRNADGSLAQMCGNGARVFAAQLRRSGLVTDDQFHIATRGGTRRVQVAADGRIRVDMGPAQILDRQDISVTLGDGTPVGDSTVLGVLLPNPHAVTWVDDVAEAGDLVTAPIVAPAEAYPEGVNVEFVRRVSADHLQMRVFERGVGETLSCGTGACAAAVATAHRSGTSRHGDRIQVDVPGGSVGVTWRADGGVELDGPAEFVAQGTVEAHWWEMHV